MFILEIALPIILVGIYTFLYERWKKNVNTSVLRHLIIIFSRLAFCLIIVLIMLFIFGYWFRASELQLIPIIAISLGGGLAISYFISEKFYD